MLDQHKKQLIIHTVHSEVYRNNYLHIILGQSKNPSSPESCPCQWPKAAAQGKSLQAIQEHMGVSFDLPLLAQGNMWLVNGIYKCGSFV